MSTSLVIREQAAVNPAGLGDRNAIVAVRDRIMSMIPGAADAPADVVWAAAQLAVAYRLDPFNGEVYIMRMGRKKVGDQWVDDYRAHVGVKGLRKKAREQALFTTEFRQLTPDEVKEARRNDYDPGDIGVECTLHRLDIARQCSQYGIPYAPFKATGFWRVKAKFDKQSQKWEADSIPNTWTAKDVAEKRAEINAIKRAYDLNINVADPAEVVDDEVVEVVGRKVAEYDRDRWMPAGRPPLSEFEEDVLNGSAPTAEAESAEADVPNPFDDPTLGADAEVRLDYATIADGLTGQVKTLADWAYKVHRSGDGPATKAQYGLLTKAIDDHVPDRHNLILSVLCRRYVSGAEPPSNALASKLLDFLLKEVARKDEEGKSVKGDDGKVIYDDNPKYRPDIVEVLKVIAAGI